jgi:hypothetical protein
MNNDHRVAFLPLFYVSHGFSLCVLRYPSDPTHLDYSSLVHNHG